MSESKAWTLRTRLERACNRLASGTAWRGEGIGKAITVHAVWWAWLKRRYELDVI